MGGAKYVSVLFMDMKNLYHLMLYACHNRPLATALKKPCINSIRYGASWRSENFNLPGDIWYYHFTFLLWYINLLSTIFILDLHQTSYRETRSSGYVREQTLDKSTKDKMEQPYLWVIYARLVINGDRTV